MSDNKYLDIYIKKYEKKLESPVLESFISIIIITLLTFAPFLIFTTEIQEEILYGLFPACIIFLLAIIIIFLLVHLDDKYYKKIKKDYLQKHINELKETNTNLVLYNIYKDISVKGNVIVENNKINDTRSYKYYIHGKISKNYKTKEIKVEVDKDLYDTLEKDTNISINLKAVINVIL